MRTIRGSIYKRLKIRFEDWFRYSVIVRGVLSWAMAVWGCLSFRRCNRLNRWAESHRMAVGLGIWSPAGCWLRPWVSDPVKSRVWRQERIGWSRYGVGRTQEGGALRKSLPIRMPDSNGKGVLFIWFEYDLLTLLSIRELESLLDRYRIIFMGSWSPPCYQALWSFPFEYRHELVTGLSHPDDGRRIRSLGFEATILPLYMSSWQEPGDFNPRPWAERDVDIVMVANWARFKRHWVLFDALRGMERPDLRVILIGQPDSGRTVDTIRGEAEAFGVAGQIEFLDRIAVEEVWHWLERSRVSLIFSRREGSCVAVAESLMAGAPVGLLKDAEIGSRAFINSETGILIDSRKRLPSQIISLLKEHRGSVRHWAAENISVDRSLRLTAQVLGLKHCDELIPLVCRGTLAYREGKLEKRITKEVEALRSGYELEFGLVKVGTSSG